MNKLRIKQIESGDFGPLISSISSGITLNASGSLQSQIGSLFSHFRFSINSGAYSVTGLYGATLTGYPVFSIGSTGVSDPIIMGQLYTVSNTGLVVALSSSVPSSSYYLHVII